MLAIFFSRIHSRIFYCNQNVYKGVLLIYGVDVIRARMAKGWVNSSTWINTGTCSSLAGLPLFEGAY